MTKPNPENCKNCSSKCAYDCAQLQYTIQNRTVLIISLLTSRQTYSPPQTASGSNQPFYHNSHVRTDRWDDMFSNISALLAMLIESDALIIYDKSEFRVQPTQHGETRTNDEQTGHATVLAILDLYD